MVHRAVTLQCLCNSLGVSSACVLQAQMNTQHTARVRAQLLKLKKNQKKKPRTNPRAPGRCWQAPTLPPEGSARGWVVWEGKKHRGLCPPHSSSHLAAQQLNLSLSLCPEEEAVPSDIPSCPPKPPPSHPSLPKCTPREGDDESGRREAGGEATLSLPGWAPAQSHFGNEHLSPLLSSFLSFLPSFPRRAGAPS